MATSVKYLEQVALKHVAQDAAGVVIAGPFADRHLFRDRNLHVIDIAPIPKRLEHRICETKYENVLHRIFAEVVIDPVDLLLAELFVQLLVDVLGRFQIAAEWLLNHDAAEAILFHGLARFAQPGGDPGIQFGRDREIIEAVAAAGAFALR